MIQIGDKLEIKQNKKKYLTNIFENSKHKYQQCGVDPYHINMKFILVKTYDDKYIVRVFGGKQHYNLQRDVFKKVN